MSVLFSSARKKQTTERTKGAVNHFCLGFAFDVQRHGVLLIQKRRPDWQAGAWNGIGGRIERGETPADAMRREFLEEAGIRIKAWLNFCTFTTVWMRAGEIAWRDAVHCFATERHGLFDAQTQTDERVLFFVDLPKEALASVKWLVPMARASMESTLIHGFKVEEFREVQR